LKRADGTGVQFHTPLMLMALSQYIPIPHPLCFVFIIKTNMKASNKRFLAIGAKARLSQNLNVRINEKR